jgi:hypothetical protein
VTRKPTQLERVIEAARSFRGTCQADWLAAETPDRGPRITRVAARMQEAEDRLGASFECIGWRNRTKVYRLTDEPDVGRGAAPLPSSGPTDPPPSSCASPDAGKTDTLFEAPARPHWQDEAA